MDDGHNKEQHVIGQRDFDFNINCSFAVRSLLLLRYRDERLALMSLV
jgi:hypothetical protein